MKIYTKTGDKGETSLIGGTRVAKHHPRIEAYGSVDELNSHVGLLRGQKIEKKSIETLLEIQDRLFTIGSLLAADPQRSRMKLPELETGDSELLEREIDRMNETLPDLKSFVLPGGNDASSFCHIARCVCRRAERLITNLAETEEVSDKILIYMNRLSDYLFVLARKIVHDEKGEETAWKPRMT